MPELDGYQAAEQIRRDSHGRHVKLIALTGWDQLADRCRASAAGFGLHLVKPAPFDKIRELISEAGTLRDEKAK